MLLNFTRMFRCQPASALAAVNLAELAWQVGDMVEFPHQSTKCQTGGATQDVRMTYLQIVIIKVARRRVVIIVDQWQDVRAVAGVPRHAEGLRAPLELVKDVLELEEEELREGDCDRDDPDGHDDDLGRRLGRPVAQGIHHRLVSAKKGNVAFMVKAKVTRISLA